ncbi:MAG: hypothetical protein K2Q22_00810, partial [Cytophagales bacterium]|nr:hypothetical protein [Cytophagales bacterium]
YSSPTLGGNFFSTNGNTSFIAFTSALPSATAAVMAKWQDASNSNGNRQSWEIMPSGALRFDFPSSGVGTIFSTSTIASMSYIGTMVTENNMDSISVNSTLENVKAITTNTSNITKNGVFQMGANYTTMSFPFQGNIGEIIYFNTRLPKLEQRKIESYLALKYGISLGNNANPFSYLASDGTTTAWTGSNIYQNNIAGIGRDDLSGLNQKQSKSSNLPVNSIVTMALGTIASSNLANTNTFSANKTFEIWGDNGGPVLENSVDLPSGILQKSQRIWRLQETGTVGTVRVRFDLSATAYAGLGADYSNLRMLVDGDGLFATGATVVTPVNFDNTNHVMEFDFNFSNGQFFTFGTPSKPLSINELNLEVEREGKITKLIWTATKTERIAFYEVEKMGASGEWERIQMVQPNKQGNNKVEGQYLDFSKEKHRMCYRIKAVRRDSSAFHSGIRCVDVPSAQEYVRISPIPVEDWFDIENQFGEPIRFDVWGNQGNKVIEGELDAGESRRVNTATISSGIYLIKWQSESGFGFSQKVVVGH